MLNVNKKYLCLIVMLCSFTCLTNAYWQNGWSVSPVTLSGQPATGSRVAMDSAGNAIVAWIRYDGSNEIVQVRRYVQATDSWDSVTELSVAGEVDKGPQVAMDSGGNAIAVWSRSNGANYIIEARRYVQATDSWDSVEYLSVAGEDALRPQVAMDSAGNAIVVWYRSNGANDIIEARRYVQATDSWDSVTYLSAALEDANLPQVAMDSFGNAIAVWYRSNRAKDIVQASRYVQVTDSWDLVPTDLSAAGESAYNPKVAMDSAGNASAVWYRSNGANNIIQARRYVQATDSWDLVTDLSAAGESAYNPNVAMDSAGNAIVVWYRTDGSNTIIQARRYVQATDSWDLVTDLSAALENAGAPKVAMDSAGNASAVWHRYDGSNYKAQASYYNQSTGTWSAPINLSAALQNASSPQVVMGSGIAVWVSGNSPNYVIQASHFTSEPCGCPVVRYENITSLPTVYGEVGQLQIAGSRLGAEAHLMIDGGWVRELIHLSSCRSGDAPVSVIVLQNDGRVGLGSTHRNVDSLEASVVLGVNGVTLITNGNSRVDLNEDLIINNVCHILTGPDFGSEDVQKLIIHSDEGHTIRVKSTGVLDMGSFTTTNQLIEFSGDLKIVLEPGAKVMLGGSTMIVTDNVRIECDTLSDNQVPEGSSVTATDAVRVKFVGTGRVQFKGNSKFVVNKGAFVGIESFEECNIFDTALRFELNEYSKIFLGEDVEGGAFQVGNTTAITDANITFSLLIYGYDAGFIINSQGFLGFNVGVAGKANEQPNSWYVNTLHNVDLISIDVNNGMFVHDRIFTGTDPRASLVALGLSQTTTTTFYFEYSPVADPDITNISKSTIRGGGNFALIKESPTSINPVVLDDDGVISDYLSVGLLASKPLLGTADLFGFGNAEDLFNYWKTVGLLTNAEVSIKANAASGLRNKIRLGFIDRNKIGRNTTYSIVGDGGIFSKQEHTLEIGAVQLLFGISGDAPREALQAFELN